MTHSGPPTDESVTHLLHLWVAGDAPAGARLFSLVYDELRLVARGQRRRWIGETTLDTTALVHEVFLRLNGSSTVAVTDRAHFFAIAARAIRHILSNYARGRRTGKRGDGMQHVTLDRVDDMIGETPHVDARDVDRLWDLEIAMQELHAVHPRPCRVVECRYFGGLSIPDTALALGISEPTVKRDWALAQAWLYRALAQHAPTHD
jgi:RNA polymerase sigma factor (TIGR02999 family)